MDINMPKLYIVLGKVLLKEMFKENVDEFRELLNDVFSGVKGHKDIVAQLCSMSQNIPSQYWYNNFMKDKMTYHCTRSVTKNFVHAFLKHVGNRCNISIGIYKDNMLIPTLNITVEEPFKTIRLLVNNAGDTSVLGELDKELPLCANPDEEGMLNNFNTQMLFDDIRYKPNHGNYQVPIPVPLVKEHLNEQALESWQSSWDYDIGCHDVLLHDIDPFMGGLDPFI